MELTKNCTGCMACYNICPNNAITIEYNEFGFYGPKIDNSKCTNCGLCSSICPQIQPTKLHDKPQKCYAVIANDELRKNSASGGIFAHIAKEYLKNGGYVCAASFSDDFKKVNHIIISKSEDLIKLQNSKYIQSNIGNTFKEIKKLLDDKKEVFFCGTPCQVAGLNNFLNKEYSNLLTMDLICFGIPSPYFWEKYTNEITNNKKIINAYFRNKKRTWHKSQSLEFIVKNRIFNKKITDSLYFRGFLEYITTNTTCHDCKYASLNRTADLTAGDFWGIDKIDSEMNDKLGVSVLTINSIKGQKAFDKHKNTLLKYREYDIKAATAGNPRLEKKSKAHISHDFFIKNIYKLPAKENIKECLCPKYDGIIRNYWSYHNFGATLSAYAIQQYFLERGKKYYLLLNSNPTDYTKEFANKYLKTTHLVFSENQFKELNKCTNNFILGTDQVLRPDFMEGKIGKDLYEYTDFNKNRIVFSGSFGFDRLKNIDKIGKLKYSKLIKRFDCISTREIEGKEICKKEFSINSDYIIDPVFLIDKNKWLQIAPDTKEKYKDKIVCYMFQVENCEFEKIKQHIEKIYNKEVVKIENNKIPTEEFISAIKDCYAVITNSFHATCFSLIFNKKFLAITNVNSNDSRFQSLKKIFNIDNLTINSYNEIFSKEELFEEYDYNKLPEIIEYERKRADIWFKNNITDKKKITFKKILAEIDYKIFKYFEKFLNFCYNIKFYYLCNNKNAKIVMWGASLYLDDFLNKNPKIAKNILGIIDKNKAMHYKNFHGTIVYPPEKLGELNPNIIISTIKNNHEKVHYDIKKYLEENYPNIKLMPDIFD